MPVLVMKFGGTSVATLDRIKRAAKRVALEVAKGYDVIVIVSAMSGKTNELVGWVNETSPLYDAREYDAVVSAGLRSGPVSYWRIDCCQLLRRVFSGVITGSR